MTKYNIFKIIETALNLPSGTITENSSRQDFIEWDSLGYVKILAHLEQNSSKTIPDDLIFLSVIDILDFYEIKD